MNKLKLLLPIFLLMIFACSEEEKIRKVKFWKYAEGASFADILSFNSDDYRVKNDTIFKLDTPLYSIESNEQRFLSNDQVLHLRELKTGKTARYVAK